MVLPALPLAAAGGAALRASAARLLGSHATRVQISALIRRNMRMETRLQWFGERVAKDVRLSGRTRLKLAAQLLRDRTVINLSRPVRKVKRKVSVTDPNTGRSRKRMRTVVDPTSRSKPGEFPRADTTRLMKDIFWELTIDTPKQMTAVVGTTLDYGLTLETRMNRSFLVRTLAENLPMLRRVFTQGKGGGHSFGAFQLGK